MKPAEDAVWIDTTSLDVEGMVERALQIVEARRTR
jgi:cytidylate kinase